MPDPHHVEVVHGIADLRPSHGRLFVVVGVFDGLHRGHLYLLRHLRREAHRRDARPAVVTFDAHPDEVVLGAAPPLLCDLDERLARLGAAGVEVTVVQHFDVALRMTPYDRFVEMLRERVDLAGFLMTPDAAFGHERHGTPAAVAELGRRDGFEVVVVLPLDLDGTAVRSAEVRAAVAGGDLPRVRHLLGRPLAIVGRVEGGAVAASPRLELPIPMVLPPAGRYRAIVEPAWAPTQGIPRPPERAALPATISVAPDGALGLDGLRPPAGARMRVTFLRRLA